MLEKRQRYFLIGFDLFTIILWGWILLEFLSKGRLPVWDTLAELYLLVLAYYVGDKEIRRWQKRYRSRQRRGERFVILWAGTAFALLIFEVAGSGRHGYHLPQSLPLLTGGVLAIYLITEYLKAEFRRRAR